MSVSFVMPDETPTWQLGNLHAAMACAFPAVVISQFGMT
jgi:hypothetical protein